MTYWRRFRKEYHATLNRAQPMDWASPWFGAAAFVMSMWWARKRKRRSR